MEKTDVLVVGAGPAGSIVAKTIAEAGFSVQIHEEHPVVGLPLACGEGMSLFMLNRFPWAPKEGYPLYIQYISFPGGYRTYSSIEAISLDRTVFDQTLCKMAQNEGAQLNTNTSVKKYEITDFRYLRSFIGLVKVFKSNFFTKTLEGIIFIFQADL